MSLIHEACPGTRAMNSFPRMFPPADSLVLPDPEPSLHGFLLIVFYSRAVVHNEISNSAG